MAAPQKNENHIVLLDQPGHSYDLDQIQEFIKTVFHVEPEGEILVYSPEILAQKPSLPMQGGVKELIQRLSTEKKGRGCYFNACTFERDYEKVLRHNKDYFVAMHLVVMESDKKSTKEFPPTYSIRTGPKSWQHGYVLKDPITDWEHASILCQLVAMAGYSENVTPSSVLRLPDGLVGDFGIRQYPITLESLDGPYWTTEALVDRLGVTLSDKVITWKDAITSEGSPLHLKHGTHFLQNKPVSQQLNGAIDPLLEWMYRNNFVLADSGDEWVDICCPQSSLHHSVTASAQYKAIGRGKRPTVRDFQCSEISCSSFGVREFISYMLVHSEFQSIPETDPSAPLFKDYIFDGPANTVWRATKDSIQPFLLSGFRNQHNTPAVNYVMANGKASKRSTSAAEIWLDSPYRMVAAGVRHAPGDDRLTKDREGRVWVNSYRPAPWGSGDYDMGWVIKFLKHIEYLLPDEEEREYFLDWISCKVQNPRFRGTAIVMVAEGFGVGRGTLGNMLTQLVGTHNAMGIPFEKLVNPGEFNYWEDKQLVIISEAKETSRRETGRSPHVAYEALKSRVDTTVYESTLNIKNQAHRTIMVTVSYLIMTNHVGSVSIPDDDRRITVLTNPRVAAPIEYFVDLYQTYLAPVDKDGQPIWARHVYRYLLQRKVEDKKRLLLPMRTLGKTKMVRGMIETPVIVGESVSRAMMSAKKYFIAIPTMLDIMRRTLEILDDPMAHTYTNNYLIKSADASLGNIQNIRSRIPGWMGPQRIRMVTTAFYTLRGSEISYKNIYNLPNGSIPKDLKIMAMSSVVEIAEKEEIEKIAQEAAERTLEILPFLNEGPE